MWVGFQGGNYIDLVQCMQMIKMYQVIVNVQCSLYYIMDIVCVVWNCDFQCIFYGMD